MSRRVARPRNVLRVPRFLAVLIAVTAVVVGTVAPFELATASASVSASTSQARSLSDPAKSSIAKTSLAGFNAGNIISDAVFTNKSTMTEAQIQSFFNSKVSKCVVGKDEDGKPYVCLKDFKITSVNRVADAYCDGYTGAANESAARIIYRVAQSCDINPQVLIVMLQKEQGLVTHVWPSAWRYNIALGQGCPDTAPCDPGYIGFFHQIYGAARQMQMYMEGRWFNWYAPGNTWQIQYHPDRARCGTGAVYVANKATSALYYYTPYQPNAAALRANYGEGDACSSYGNRNFYNYFTDWFGSTHATVPKPELSSVDRSNYVLATGADGRVWGYPFEKGYWGPKVELTSGLSGMKSTFSVGDLDGDGRRDLVAADAANKAWLLRGTAQGFSAPKPINVDWSGTKLIAPAGDFDGDGVPDMFTTKADGSLLLWRGNDLGSFHQPVVVGRGWQNISFLSGGLDFTKDGRPDLIARDAQGRLFLYAGNGRGGWAISLQIGQGWQNMSVIMNAGDFSGDSQPDLLARDGAGTLWLYSGRGGGAVNAGIEVGTGWQSFVSIENSGTPSGASRTLKPGVGDMDSDGASDVAALSSSGQVVLYRGSGRAGWLGTTTISSGWGTKDRLVALGDFDRDGRRDIGRTTEQGAFMLYRGTGGSLGAGVQIGHGWSSLELVFGGMDFDGDRNTDVLARNAGGDLVLYRGNGAGGWGESRVIGSGWGAIDAAFYAGDFDGDGRGDIIARRTDGTLWLYPTTGAGGWGAARQIGQGWSGLSGMFSPGDFDGDGRMDVLARNSSGELLLYSGDGRGGWQGVRSVGKGWSSIAQIG
ncbi:FG-GAP repeat domain-containing protein [Microbacterium aerolatum]|uniref:FG-GAP repeat domain-containing protein n=1 Tax=Microbacterium aerolatum TaxID=153731 RepID=UPI00384B8E29